MSVRFCDYIQIGQKGQTRKLDYSAESNCVLALMPVLCRHASTPFQAKRCLFQLNTLQYAQTVATRELSPKTQWQWTLPFFLPFQAKAASTVAVTTNSIQGNYNCLLESGERVD